MGGWILNRMGNIVLYAPENSFFRFLRLWLILSSKHSNSPPPVWTRWTWRSTCWTRSTPSMPRCCCTSLPINGWRCFRLRYPKGGYDGVIYDGIFMRFDGRPDCIEEESYTVYWDVCILLYCILYIIRRGGGWWGIVYLWDLMEDRTV